MIELKVDERSTKRIDEIIGQAVLRHIDAGGGYYDEDGDWVSTSGGIIESKAKQITEELVTEKVKELIKTHLEDRVKELIDAAFEEGFRVAYQTPKKPAEYINDVLKARSWTAPREFKRDGMTFIELVAWNAAKGQIEEQAKALVVEMRESLSQQIAQNLSDQLAGRMLKGAQ